MVNKNCLDLCLSSCENYLVSHLTEQSLYSGWVIKYSSFNAIASSKSATFNQLLQNNIRLEAFNLNRYIFKIVSSSNMETFFERWMRHTRRSPLFLLVSLTSILQIERFHIL